MGIGFLTKSSVDLAKNVFHHVGYITVISIITRATGPGAQLAIPSLTRIWLGDRDRE